jgi:hypothetical protein
VKLGTRLPSPSKDQLQNVPMPPSHWLWRQASCSVRSGDVREGISRGRRSARDLKTHRSIYRSVGLYRCRLCYVEFFLLCHSTFVWTSQHYDWVVASSALATFTELGLEVTEV